MRMRRWSAPIALVAALPLTVAPTARTPAKKEPPVPPVVYTPGVVQYVAGPGVMDAEWSPDGQYILLTMPSHQPGGPDFRLVLWSRRTQRAVLDWTPPWPQSHLLQITWFAGGHIPLVSISGVEPDGQTAKVHLMQLDAAKRGVTERQLPNLGPIAVMNDSPTQPLILLQEMRSTVERIWLLTPDAVSGPITPPEGLQGNVWSRDGATPVFLSFPGGGKTAFTRFDPATKRWDLLPERPPLYKQRKPPYQVVRRAAPVRNGEARGALVHPLWLVSGEGPSAISVLLCAEGEGRQVSPRGDAVLYQTDGIALMREVIAQPGTQYVAKRREADIERAKQNSKEIALALIQYGNDYGNVFPPAEGMQDAMDAQIRSGDVWYGADGGPGFAYVINGGPFPDNPAETLLGYTPAPGGRWNVFADGHVTWSADPERP